MAPRYTPPPTIKPKSLAMVEDLTERVNGLQNVLVNLLDRMAVMEHVVSRVVNDVYMDAEPGPENDDVDRGEPDTEFAEGVEDHEPEDGPSPYDMTDEEYAAREAAALRAEAIAAFENEGAPVTFDGLALGEDGLPRETGA